jgi:DNA replication licensing factor MCM3
MHRYQRPGHEGKPLPLYDDALAGQLLEGLDDHAEGDETSPVFQKHNPLLHASYGSGRSDKLFHTEFIRKYVNYAKSRVKPTLTDEASAIIVADYVELRQEQATKTLPITPRCLETMIRLATAHAKARLSALVEPADCYAARAILKFALYNDTGGDEERKRDQGTAVEKKTKHKTSDSQKKKKKKARRVDSSSESEEEEDDDDDDNDEEDDPARAAQDELEAAAAEDMDVPAAAPQLSGEARLSIFTRALAQLFHDSQKDELPMREIIEAANKALASQHRQAKAYNPDEAEANLRVLDEQNKVMYRDGIAWRI